MSNAFLIVGTFGTPRGETETSFLASSITRPDLIRLRAVEMQTILSKTPRIASSMGLDQLRDGRQE